MVTNKDQTFSQKLERLEEIVTKLESPDVDLEDGLKLLEEGVALHKDCQQMLTQTQTKITQLLDATKTESADAPTTKAESTEQSEATELFSDNDYRASESETEQGLPF